MSTAPIARLEEPPPRIVVYTIPAAARIPSDGGHGGCRRLGYVPAGHYIEHPQMPCHAQRTLLIPVADPGGLTWAHVRAEKVARFARLWGPQDHNGPIAGRCFLGLNFTAGEMAIVLKAICAVPAGNEEDSAVEPLLARICREWLRRACIGG